MVIYNLLQQALNLNASDIHITVGINPSKNKRKIHKTIW